MKKFIALLVLGILFIFCLGFGAGRYSALEAIQFYVMHKDAAQPVKYPEYPTGYEVLDELNAYRKSKGLSYFKESPTLCNNIAQRWQNYKDNNSHVGLKDFLTRWMPGVRVNEILAPGSTAKETIENWAGSPSHELAIRTHTHACVYSADGLSVALLSNL